MPLLSMPLFVNPQDVMLRMQMNPDLAGTPEIVESGIIGAQLHVERLIDSKLQRRSQDCIFFTDAQAFSGLYPNGAFRLEVPSGLVRQDTPQVVTVSRDASPFAEYEAIDTSLMKFDYPRGYLYVDAETYGDHHVRIKCDTGFEDGTRALPLEGVSPYVPAQSYTIGDVVVYGGVTYRCIVTAPVGTLPTNAQYWAKAVVAMEPIPNEIYEAIMALVPMVFNTNQTTNRSDEAKNQYQTQTDHASLLLQPYSRLKGFTFRAL